MGQVARPDEPRREIVIEPITIPQPITVPEPTTAPEREPEQVPA